LIFLVAEKSATKSDSEKQTISTSALAQFKLVIDTKEE